MSSSNTPSFTSQSEAQSGTGSNGGNALELTYRRLDELRPNPRNARNHPKRKIRDLANQIRAVGFIGAIIIDETGLILAGHARHLAAKLLGLSYVPTICVRGLSEAQKRAFVLADNKFAERAAWNKDVLVTELQELSALLPELNLDMAITGFEPGELEILLSDAGEEKSAPEDLLPPTIGPSVSRLGEIWLLGKHRVSCADARDPVSFSNLMHTERAAAVFTDPPYNVPIAGHVQGRGKFKHAEFAVASGELSDSEFQAFLAQTLGLAARVSRGGAVHYICMDWRHIETLMRVAREIYGAVLNLAVWNKVNAGQGSFYRSQHELVGIFRVGNSPHRNNIELGRHGRNRTNMWTYPGLNSFGAGRDQALAIHPTIKPTALVADAIRDCTARGDLILDPFIGAGTTAVCTENLVPLRRRTNRVS